ncbi:hypothetical protein BSL78_29948 [Apostichopus japonicus]|uniref:Uncharacterized protein n=1 Tax=Stichopus japonicus TaxID=307972 RepID=A0A2G8JBW9_STIJA|nr:hypothetical protein BSL78_29948 [Apostichopus japonicus]
MESTQKEKLMARNEPVNMKNALALPAGPLTRAKAKKLKEAISSMLNKENAQQIHLSLNGEVPKSTLILVQAQDSIQMGIFNAFVKCICSYVRRKSNFRSTKLVNGGSSSRNEERLQVELEAIHLRLDDVQNNSNTEAGPRRTRNPFRHGHNEEIEAYYSHGSEGIGEPKGGIGV